jgi:hypothetical protein
MKMNSNAIQPADFLAVKQAFEAIHDASRNALALLGSMERGATPADADQLLALIGEVATNFRTVQEHGADAVAFSGLRVDRTCNDEPLPVYGADGDAARIARNAAEHARAQRDWMRGVLVAGERFPLLTPEDRKRMEDHTRGVLGLFTGAKGGAK